MRVLEIATLVVVAAVLGSAANAVTVDLSLDAIVNGPTRTAAGDKDIVAKITNLGDTDTTVCDTDIFWSITVNGTPTSGFVSPLDPGCDSLRPGGSTRFRFRWAYGSGEPGAGAVVAYTATVAIAGDANAGNDSDTEIRTAK